MQDIKNYSLIRWLTFLMFMMFAMTTDAVGVIIPEIMKQFDISMTQAGLIHYGPMAAIALAGIGFGFLADRFGRKATIIMGLSLFSATALLFVLGSQFYYYLGLMLMSGLAIGIFKTAALALIGDISRSNTEHTSTMNGVEAFFGVGAILGPLIVTSLLHFGVEWKWLYLIAACLCIALILVAVKVEYPSYSNEQAEKVSIKQTIALTKNPYALGFSIAAFLYVATECAIYVWMPTFLSDYQGPVALLASYALAIFFVLRALGRFLGMWLMAHFDWAKILFACSALIFLCFILSVVYGPALAVFCLPLSGLFMSVIYPTLNSKGISCFQKHQHGTAAGVILFFTALGAALGPLAMGVISDAFGGKAQYGFILACGFAGLLCTGLLYNLLTRPVERRLRQVESEVY